MLKPEWKIYDTANICDPTLAGVNLRNEAGLCGFAECKKPLSSNNCACGVFGKICDDCAKSVNELLLKIDNDIKATYSIKENTKIINALVV